MNPELKAWVYCNDRDINHRFQEATDCSKTVSSAHYSMKAHLSYWDRSHTNVCPQEPPSTSLLYLPTKTSSSWVKQNFE